MNETAHRSWRGLSISRPNAYIPGAGVKAGYGDKQAAQ
jgi:hypothetical protein